MKASFFLPKTISRPTGKVVATQIWVAIHRLRNTDVKGIVVRFSVRLEYLILEVECDVEKVDDFLVSCGGDL